jgi:hypothetical protein
VVHAEAGSSACPQAIASHHWILFVAGALSLLGCSYEVVLGSVTTYPLTVRQCGTWDISGVHTTNEYFVGHSVARPNDTISYFVFDLSPVQGKSITAARLTLPGRSDWKVTVPEPGTTDLFDFKLGTTPLPAGITLAQVTGGANDPSVYHDVRSEQDLGFAWVSSGSTTNTYEAFHYDHARLQRAVDAGGMYALFAVSRFADTAVTEQYLYGGATCGPAVFTIEAE